MEYLLGHRRKHEQPEGAAHGSASTPATDHCGRLAAQADFHLIAAS
jgi:hypothetical protein